MKPIPRRETPRALPHVAKQLGTSVGELLYTNPKKIEKSDVCTLKNIYLKHGLLAEKAF
jgi:hypothetical protein